MASRIRAFYVGNGYLLGIYNHDLRNELQWALQSLMVQMELFQAITMISDVF